MNCIVTAGPCWEPIDRVRRLSNFSTGRLGCGLADYLVRRGHTVHLLLGETSTIQPPATVEIVERFAGVGDLERCLSAHADSKVDAVFHAAAVSDFLPGKAWVRDESGRLTEQREGKVSSRRGALFIELAPAPKIIRRLRAWFPQAFLAGWKYEVDGDRRSALTKGREQIAGNDTDICVVNGPAYGAGFGIVSLECAVALLADSEQLYEWLLGRLEGLEQRLD